MNPIKDWLTPNATLPPHISQVLFITILAIFYTIWNTAAPIINLPTMIQIYHALLDLITNQKLLYHLFVVSVPLELKAIGLSTLISLGLVSLTMFPFFNTLTKVISAFRFLSLSGLLYIFIAVIHTSHTVKLAVLTFGLTVFLVPALLAETTNVPNSQKNYARTLGFPEWRVFIETSIIAKLDTFWDMIFNNAAMALLMMVMIEAMVVSEGGIGVLLMAANHEFHLDRIFAIQFTILTFALIQDYLAFTTKRYLFPYAFIKKEKSS